MRRPGLVDPQPHLHRRRVLRPGGRRGGRLTVAFGFLDLIRIPAERHAAQRPALLHAGINTVVLMSFSVLFFPQWQ
ncbi:hypothetical protein [Hymenobacter antarcticus]|uniref:hypothetical protein n=1 Tax=Hymenobacter antarcticus TaxID=486270 RepID=UPI0031EF0438